MVPPSFVSKQALFSLYGKKSHFALAMPNGAFLVIRRIRNVIVIIVVIVSAPLPPPPGKDEKTENKKTTSKKTEARKK